MSEQNSNAAAKAALVEKAEREEPNVFAFYGGFESADAGSKHIVIGASKHLFNNFFPVRVLIPDGTSKELALEFLRMVTKDIERYGVLPAPADFRERSETFIDGENLREMWPATF